MFLAFGIVCGVLEAQRSGQGQVIDAAMVDGTAMLMSMMWGLKQIGVWDERSRHQRARHRRAVLRHVRDDGRQVRLARLARAAVLRRAPRAGSASTARSCPRRWTESAGQRCATRFTELFKTKTRDEWDEILEGTDACFAPVLTMTRGDERRAHQGARRRSSSDDGVPQPAPAPRFSRTPGEVQRSAPWPGQHTDEALADWGFTRPRSPSSARPAPSRRPRSARRCGRQRRERDRRRARRVELQLVVGRRRRR